MKLYYFKIGSLHIHNNSQWDLDEDKNPLICFNWSDENSNKRKCCIYSFFRWYDLWVGFYWDKKSKVLYFIPIPTIGLKLQF